MSSRQSVANGLTVLVEDLEDEELRAAAADHALRVEGCIRELIEEAIEREELAPTDAVRLARAVHAAWNGAVIQWALRGRGALEPFIEDVVDVVLFGPARAARTRPRRPSRT